MTLQANPTNYIIRPYLPADRDAVRQICCDTGFSGDPIDPLFSDRDVFADFFTRYYTDWEPESAWVAESNGHVVGYLIGCIHYRYHKWVDLWILCSIIAPKVFIRLTTGKYNAQSRKFLWWSCFNAPFVKRVYAQIQTRDGRRTARVFRKFGFEILNQKGVSKFQDFHQDTVYVTTIVKELR